MASFWDIVNKVIKESDVILMVLDSRFASKTVNKEVANKVMNEGKMLIYVLNKSDLIPKELQDKLRIRFRPGVSVSAVKRYGKTLLRNKILQLCKKDNVVVGVLGYPNTGKSSVINMMKGRGSAPVSSKSGFTKGIQRIRADNRIVLLDTPGVIPYGEKDESKHSVIGTIDVSDAKDPEGFVYYVLEEYPGLLESYYEVDHTDDPEEFLENAAQKYKKIKSGGLPDTYVMAKQIMKDWQTGKIRIR